MEKRRRERFLEVARRRQRGLTVVLEDIHDPHNAAAVFRTCDAFGVQDVHLIFSQEKPWNPRRLGKAASSSASKWLDFTIWRSTDSCLTTLKRRGYRISATALGPDAKIIGRANLVHPKLALVFGNEHRGLSTQALKLADQKLIIPMQGFVQSLNLSVTAAICLFEATRRRAVVRRPQYLSTAAALTLARRFAKR